MNDKDKRELIKLIEKYGELKTSLALAPADGELETNKDLTLSKIINIIKEI